WFGSEFSREGVRGVAVFSAELDDLFLALPLPWPVGDEARIAGQLYLAPLVRVVGRGDGALVAYVGRGRGDDERLPRGELIPLAARFCSCRRAPTGRPTSARSAAVRRRSTAAARSTARPCSRPTPVSISPSTRR